MTPLKKYLLTFLVTLAVVQTGFGGLRDMFGVGFLGMTKEHAWNDGIFLMLLAILVAIVL
jgi:hypothetical protein